MASRSGNSKATTATALGLAPDETEQTIDDVAPGDVKVDDFPVTHAGVPPVTDPAEQQIQPLAAPQGSVVPEGGAMNFVLNYLANKAQSTEDEDAVIAEAIATRILNADSLDEVLDPLGTLKSDDLLNKPLMVYGFRVLHSDIDDGYPYYALLDVQAGGGEPHKVVSIGGTTVLIQLVKLDLEEAWPQAMAITKAAKPTRRGFYPLQLVRPQDVLR
jgi:hypothetical protein